MPELPRRIGSRSRIDEPDINITLRQKRGTYLAEIELKTSLFWRVVVFDQRSSRVIRLCLAILTALHQSAPRF